ncbi:hypothetical protein N7474_004376 [Penicillium riverlandense]|uniref:uncharacterized protein n=1 Tax=Penicillium riverlandense TaxID=1903569 RepID=UPI00254820B4|nr:uncharacterized protein N7474_004376 [Penicillium riverlandense]KAJ5818785.1 hypothetical protein N7474_004376 [Penicillium riverlandense]
MPSLKDILHKRDELSTSSKPQEPPPFPTTPPTPEFKFIRSDTISQEILTPPEGASTSTPDHPLDSPEGASASSSASPRRSLSFRLFHRTSRSPSVSSGIDSVSGPSPPRSLRGENRLSSLFLNQRSNSTSRSASRASVNLPSDLPQIVDEEDGDKQDRESQWEKRATMLVQQNPNFLSSGLSSPSPDEAHGGGGDYLQVEGLKARVRSSSVTTPTRQEDVNIQEAIRLHESGDLERSTAMFGNLADPDGANNALSQVLYGLALRHGWGCTPNPALAITYLRSAASNSAAIESEALRAGIKKGGAAKGELVLAIFELANCFRNGWGVEKDPAAARQYYETAANLGDTDAMNEAAFCFLEGIGGKKDKVRLALLLLLAEVNGCPTLGNSWIWKDKYNPK